MPALSVEEVLKHLRTLPTMGQLDSAKFADEDGWADTLAVFFVQKDEKEKKERLKPTQLRKVFHALKDVERQCKGQKDDTPFDIAKVLHLKPELAYALGRELIPKQFYDLMKECLTASKLKTVADYKRLVEFVTAILAYHKYRKEVG